MRPAIVRLIDLGFHNDFTTSMSFAQSLIQSLSIRPSGTEFAEIEYIRTRDAHTVRTAMQYRSHVLHIMSHGAADADFVGFFTDDDLTKISLSDLAEQFARDGEGIETAVVFADCCDSAQGRFVRAVRDCIEQPVAYIGAHRAVDFYEATTFASAFYGSYFKDKGYGLSPSKRGITAARRAIRAYKAMVGDECPFTVETLSPSRKAVHSLAIARE